MKKNLKLWGIKDDQTFNVLAKFQTQITFEETSSKKTKSVLKVYVYFLAVISFLFVRAPQCYFWLKF